MEQEISIREIIAAILRGKWIIIGVTSLFVIVAIIYSFVIIKPTYEAKATVMINNVEQPVGAFSDYINNATSRDMIINIMKSPEVIERTIKEFNIESSVQSFQSALNVVSVQNNESLIRISFKGTNRGGIQKVLDSLIKNTIEEVEATVNTFLESQETVYLQKMKEEQQQLEKYLQEYTELEEAVGLPLLILFQENTNGPQYILEATESLLLELRELDKNTQIQYEEINRLINRSHEKYLQYYDYYNNAITAKSFNITNNKIILVSNPFVDNNPVGPNKKLNIAIALVLGGILSVLLVFFHEIIKNSKK